MCASLRSVSPKRIDWLETRVCRSCCSMLNRSAKASLASSEAKDAWDEKAKITAITSTAAMAHRMRFSVFALIFVTNVGVFIYPFTFRSRNAPPFFSQFTFSVW